MTDEQKRDLIKQIPIGDAIPRDALAMRWGVADRTARKIIAELREDPGDDPYIIAADPYGYGYRRTCDPTVVRHWMADGAKRALKLLKPIARGRRILANLGVEAPRPGAIDCRLCDLRRAAGMTQPQLVEAVKAKCPAFDRPLLSKAETGSAVLPPDALVATAEALHVEPAEIYPGLMAAYVCALYGVDVDVCKR
jgi:hypothetical protein